MRWNPCSILIEQQACLLIACYMFQSNVSGPHTPYSSGVTPQVLEAIAAPSQMDNGPSIVVSKAGYTML